MSELRTALGKEKAAMAAAVEYPNYGRNVRIILRKGDDMPLDFETSRIPVNASTAQWGPYAFNFRAALPNPESDPINDAAVTSWQGDVETTGNLMDGEPVVMSPIVQIKLKYPGAQFAGKHTLKFVLTMQGGGVNEFNFGYVEVE